jgi:DNA primase
VTDGPTTETIEPQSEPEAQPGDEASTVRLRERAWNAVGGFGWFRALVAVLGAVGFAVGIVVAWRADNAVTLIAASAVLIVVAMFGPDWQEIRAKYGGAELLLRQTRDEAIAEAVTDSATFEEWRSRVERIEEEFQAMQSATRLKERRSELARQLAAERSWRPPTAQGDPLAEALMNDARVEHVRTDEGVFLRLTISGFGRLVTCDVVDPVGQRHTAVAQGGSYSNLNRMPFGPRRYETVYPSAFGVEELRPGPYLVEWKSKSIMTVMSRAVVVARDSFTIEGGNAVETREAETGRDPDASSAAESA